MEWLTYADAKALAKALGQTQMPQVISLVADICALRKDIPTPPELIPVGEGPPSPMHAWYGRIGAQLIGIQCEAGDVMSPMSVLVHTSFSDKADQLGDWAVLFDLECLPQSVYVTRPLFIQSRTCAPLCTVYRRDPQGWRTAIYQAPSRGDAENLLSFLKRDKWNAECVIGDPESTGKWAVMSGESDASGSLGTYPDRNLALKLACDISLRSTPATALTVRDLSGTNTRDFYVVREGRVLHHAVPELTL